MIAPVRAAVRALLAAPIEALQEACDALDPEDRDRLRALVETAPRLPTITFQLSVPEGDRFSAGWGVGYARGVVGNMRELADEQEAEGAISPAELRERADAFEANADNFVAQLGRAAPPAAVAEDDTVPIEVPPDGPPPRR